MSLRARLMLAMLVAVVIGIGIVDVVTYTLVTRAQLSLVDQDLERAHPPIERAAADSASDRERNVRDAAPGFFVELQSATGESELVIPLQRPGTEPTLLATDAIPVPDGEDGADDGDGDQPRDDEAVFATLPSTADHPLRVRVSRQEDGGILTIGRSMATLEETRERVLLALLAATAIALVVVALLGAWLVRVGLRPLADVERSASEISDTDLDQRVPGANTHTETGRLATGINHMLDRLQGAFDQRERDMVLLQQSEARMRQFVADASHELRTPLAATAAYAELFERGARDHPDDLERAMSGIRSETARMSELVEDLLLLAQLDEGRPLAESPVDLAELAASAVEAARFVQADRVVRLRVDDVVVVTGDAGRLRQVIDNLIGNVRVHTPPGVECQVTVYRDGDLAIVTVSDDGPGLPDGDTDKAFDRFHRADSSRTRASGGAGLGLAIVRAIVEAHGGTVRMSSAGAVGTTVTVQLPLSGPVHLEDIA